MKESRPLKKSISITIDSDMLEKLRNQAELCDRPLSQYVNVILKKYIREKTQPSKNNFGRDTD